MSLLILFSGNVSGGASVVPPTTVAQAPAPAQWGYTLAALAVGVAAISAQPVQPVFAAPVVVSSTASAFPYAQQQPKQVLPLIAQAVSQVFPSQVAQTAQSAWPYSVIALPVETNAAFVPNQGTQIPPSPILQTVVGPWTYNAAQPVEWTPIVTAAGQVAPSSTPQIAQGAWPYALMQPAAANAGTLAPNQGTQIPPSPVNQWLTQTPWPYSQTLIPAPQNANFAPVVVYTYSPPVMPVRVADWPYASTLVPAPTASAFGITVAYAYSPVINPVRQPEWPYAATFVPAPTASQFGVTPAYAYSPVINFVPRQEWPYVATLVPRPTASQFAITAVQIAPNPLAQLFTQTPYAYTVQALLPGPAVTVQVQAQIFPSPVLQGQPGQWPYAVTATPVETNAAFVPNLGVQIPPSPVLQWLTYPRWPAELAIKPALTSLAWFNLGVIFPAPGQVLAGVQYGPNGNDYTGTLVQKGGGAYIRRR